MDFQKIEQAMSLAVKIERIAEEVEKLLPELDLSRGSPGGASGKEPAC